MNAIDLVLLGLQRRHLRIMVGDIDDMMPAPHQRPADHSFGPVPKLVRHTSHADDRDPQFGPCYHALSNVIDYGLRTAHEHCARVAEDTKR